MKKHKTIVQLIRKVESIFDMSLIEFSDSWDGDLCALGLKRGLKTVYINTYNYIDESTPAYDYDLELNETADETKYQVIKCGRCVSEDELIDELKSFLEL